jgi:hypothetical protein
VITVRAIRPPINDEPTTDHATTAQSSTEQHLMITSKRTHLGITIRRNQELPQTGRSELIKETDGIGAPRC